MSLNASDCCKTAGCNCPGTQLAESVQAFPHWAFPVVVGIGILILFFLFWRMWGKIEHVMFDRMMKEAGE